MRIFPKLGGPLRQRRSWWGELIHLPFDLDWASGPAFLTGRKLFVVDQRDTIFQVDARPSKYVIDERQTLYTSQVD